MEVWWLFWSAKVETIGKERKPSETGLAAKRETKQRRKRRSRGGKKERKEEMTNLEISLITLAQDRSFDAFFGQNGDFVVRCKRKLR